ncbi:MAG: HD domain-containing protein [Candidatus Brocadiia bacterium]
MEHKRAKTVRDPVHGDIDLTPEELELLDTPQIQRLRGIRQLGAAFYVYPGAQHSRFEHAIGTCWMAHRLVSNIERRGEYCFPEREKRAVCLASLAHDVTHIPFGHTFEDERKLMGRHDRSVARYRYFLQRGEAGEALAGTDAGRLALTLLHPEREVPEEKRYLQQIVSGTICADLLDYLRRDNYYCGLSQEYDQRVFHYFTIDGGELRLRLHRGGLFRQDALSELTNLLRIRYVLSERVYYHHAKIACGVMISKAVERALQNGMEENEFYNLADDSLPHYLRTEYGDDDALVEVLDSLTDRRLYKRAYMLTRKIGQQEVERLVERYHADEKDERRKTEAEIARRLGAEPHEVGIYCAPEKMALKEARMPALTGDGVVKTFSDINTAEIQVLKQQHRRIWKLYVFLAPHLSDKMSRVRSICQEIMGHQNELPGNEE